MEWVEALVTQNVAKRDSGQLWPVDLAPQSPPHPCLTNGPLTPYMRPNPGPDAKYYSITIARNIPEQTHSPIVTLLQRHSFS